MGYQAFRQKSRAINSYLLISLIFFIPISTSLSSVFAILIFLFWILSIDLDELREQLRNPLIIAVLAYVSLFAIGLLWTDDLAWGLHQTEKQWKLLLLLPLMSTVVRVHYRYYLASYLTSMLFSAILSFLLWLEIINFEGVSPQYPIPFNTHISYNPLLALALYFIFHIILFRFRELSPRRLLLMITSAVVMTGSMFITTGRTGQLAFFVLLVILILQYFRRRITWGLVITSILIPLLILAAYQFGPGFKMRVDTGIRSFEGFRSKPETSIAQRLTFAINSLELATDNFILGVGTGDFPSEYKKINEINSPAFMVTDDPHNHYLLVLTQFGIIGFLVFLSIFVVQIKMAWLSEDSLKDYRYALPVFYLTIMTSGTYLLGQELSLCFAVSSAILYSKKTPSARPAN